jgi:hypothetical protein
MPTDVYHTTAESIIAVIDAVLTRDGDCDINYLAQFMDAPVPTVQNALGMAKELSLVDNVPGNLNLYQSQKPFATYLITAKDFQKAAVFRLVLENYEPYCFFKERLIITEHPNPSAEQVKVKYGLTPHRDQIRETFISLGTFAQSLISEGGGLFKVADYDPQDAACIKIVANVAVEREKALLHIRKRLEAPTADWINEQEVLNKLVIAYQLLDTNIENDSTSPVVHAGNAVESFLTQLGGHLGVNLNNAPGINAKVDTLGNNLSRKHKNMLKYLGHIRNAADHGIDPDINQSWEISKETATEYVHVSVSTIKSIVMGVLQNRHIL